MRKYQIAAKRSSLQENSYRNERERMREREREELRS